MRSTGMNSSNDVQRRACNMLLVQTPSSYSAIAFLLVLCLTCTSSFCRAFLRHPNQKLVLRHVSSSTSDHHHLPFSQQERSNVINTRRSSYCVLNLYKTSDISTNTELQPGITAIDEQNHDFYEKLVALRDQPYFRMYSVDMLASCEYLPQELFECYSETCEIYPVDDEEVPIDIKDVDSHEYEFELDGWARWDMPTDDYYDTNSFPEDYTGYDGAEIWSFIHDRICFEGYDYDDDHWKADFNKAVSGIHSMISTQIIRGIQERIESGEGFTEEEKWTDPRAEFQRRLSPTGETPLAIENLYFSYMLLLSAASKARDRLMADCANGKIDEVEAAALKPVLATPLLDDPVVGVASRKLHDHAISGEESLWEVRLRTRDLQRLMNCVQCNKCRLHGKISMMGFSTALQILVGQQGEGGDVSRVHRVELAALMSTLYKFSRAVEICQGFRRASD